MTTKHNLQHDRDADGPDPGRGRAAGERGYQFEAAEASFDLLVRRCAGTFHPHFERIKYHVDVAARRRDRTSMTEATVKLRVHRRTAARSGRRRRPGERPGRRAPQGAQRQLPQPARNALVDYKVRVVNSEAGTAARIRVFIESTDEHDVWGTVGVSENIIEASWLALVDAIEYKLCKDVVSRAAPEAG